MTIKDLARLAGVAHSTVSRSLNDSPLVSEETRQRIKELAARHGYSPNSLARKLVTRKSNTLGLFFLSLEELKLMENFGTQFLPGITSACRQAGYDLLLFTNPRDLANTDSYIRHCRERQVEGVIFIGLTSDDPHLEEIRQSPLPTAIIDFRLAGPQVSFVGTDNQRGVRLAMEWLYEQGHRSIAHIAGPRVSQVAQERAAVYQECMSGWQLPTDQLVLQGDFSRDSGYRKALDILRLRPMPTAVFAANDFMALGAMKAFKEHGLRVPVDISVMGFDNAVIAEYAEPGLTTVGQNAETVGAAAVASILDQIERQAGPRSTLVDPCLVIRESVRKLPG